ncbi:hypothetical protein D3C74_440510 [compost metagenome]
MRNVMRLEAVHLVADIEEELFRDKLSLLPQDFQNAIMRYVRKEDRDRALIGALLCSRNRPKCLSDPQS